MISFFRKKKHRQEPQPNRTVFDEAAITSGLRDALQAYDVKEVLPNNIYVETARSMCKEIVDYPTMYRYMKFAEEQGISYVLFLFHRIPKHTENEEVFLQTLAKRVFVRKNHWQKVYDNMVAESTLSQKEMAVAVNALGVTADKFRNMGWHLLSKSELEDLVIRETEKKKAAFEQALVTSGMTEAALRAHMRRCYEMYGLNEESYFEYRPWELEERDLRQYFTNGMSNCMRVFYNQKKGNNVLGNKKRFEEYYGRFLHRDSWESSSKDFDSFRAFLTGKDKVIVKPLRLMRGMGIHIVEVDDKTDVKALYEDFVSGPDVLVEEVIKQHPKMAELYSGSVNSIRLVTLNTGKEVKILTGFLRCGVSGVVDNLTAGGLLCRFDLTTGVITTDAVDHDGNLHKEHPVSHVVFKGFQIPLWEEVLKTAKEAIYEHPFVKYVGWDLAVCEDGVAVIEGNSWPAIEVGPTKGNAFPGIRESLEEYAPFGKH